ncbi:MAPEG family protein [Thermomonas brevis]
MDARAYLLPAAAMVLLTFAVWLRLFLTRIPEMKRERIHPQSVALSAQAASKFRDTRAADNFRNLFELPVLFYLALWAGHALAIAGPAYFALAWAFVALRIIHSVIHCGYNKVLHRFYAYAAGGWALWALWAVVAWHAWLR